MDGFITSIIEAKPDIIYAFTQNGIFMIKREEKDQSWFRRYILPKILAPIMIYPNNVEHP